MAGRAHSIAIPTMCSFIWTSGRGLTQKKEKTEKQNLPSLNYENDGEKNLAELDKAKPIFPICRPYPISMHILLPLFMCHSLNRQYTQHYDHTTDKN